MFSVGLEKNAFHQLCLEETGVLNEQLLFIFALTLTVQDAKIGNAMTAFNISNSIQIFHSFYFSQVTNCNKSYFGKMTHF